MPQIKGNNLIKDIIPENIKKELARLKDKLKREENGEGKKEG